MIWLLINHRMNKLNHWNQTMLHFLIVLYRYVLKSKFLMEKIKIHLQPIWNLNKVSWAEYKNLTITSTWTRMPTFSDPKPIIALYRHPAAIRYKKSLYLCETTSCNTYIMYTVNLQQARVHCVQTHLIQSKILLDFTKKLIKKANI